MATLVHGVIVTIAVVMMLDVTVVHGVTKCNVLKWFMVFQSGMVLQWCMV